MPDRSLCPSGLGRRQARVRRRLVIHDYAGHPFQVQLSRELARRGFEVLHLYAASISTPRGPLRKRADDPPSLEIEGISLPGFDKENLARRWFQEWAYGHRIVDRVAAYHPDAILSGNAPLVPQRALQVYARGEGVRFVHWWQDVYSLAISSWLKAHFPILGRPIRDYFVNEEQKIVRGSDAVVAISKAFSERGESWSVPADRLSVIPNWAPIDDIPICRKGNSWAREHQFAAKFVFMYAGTLGLKHNPRLLTALAEAFREQPDVVVVVVSEGRAADWLQAESGRRGLGNLILLPFQPFERLPEVLGTSDVLIGLLDDEAATYSVPSKVLTYLCSGRPVLLAAPENNLASRTVRQAGGGVTCPSHDVAIFVDAAQRLMIDKGLREVMGSRGRAFAEGAFDISSIADKFSVILSEA